LCCVHRSAEKYVPLLQQAQYTQLAEKLVSYGERKREEALDVDDLICYDFLNYFSPEPFCIGQKEVPQTTVKALPT